MTVLLALLDRHSTRKLGYLTWGTGSEDPTTWRSYGSLFSATPAFLPRPDRCYHFPDYESFA